METLREGRVLITGASRGIGAEAAVQFAQAGADVALLARGRRGLEQVARRVRAEGRRAVVAPADVTDRDALQAAVGDAVRRLGGLDVVVVNAAATVHGPFEEVDPEDFDRVVRVTFTGAVDTIRATLPALEESEGTLVVTGSLMSKLPLPTFSSYAAAKHALRGFLGTLRVELEARRSPVTVSVVHPGSVDTPLWEHTRSATGALPRRPPEGDAAGSVARALVAMALDPQPEVTLGAEAKAIEVVSELVPPLGDVLLTAVQHYFMTDRARMGDAEAAARAIARALDDHGLTGTAALTLPVRLVARPARAAVATLLRR